MPGTQGELSVIRNLRKRNSMLGIADRLMQEWQWLYLRAAHVSPYFVTAAHKEWLAFSLYFMF